LKFYLFFTLKCQKWKDRERAFQKDKEHDRKRERGKERGRERQKEREKRTKELRGTSVNLFLNAAIQGGPAGDDTWYL
jgi:hypothetical protein